MQQNMKMTMRKKIVMTMNSSNNNFVDCLIFTKKMLLKKMDSFILMVASDLNSISRKRTMRNYSKKHNKKIIS